ncbi:hypothetical protein D1006_25910 [Burkholderia stabilis]|uniref:Uncharacterized protein n=1 Tax=Burkholderia stabilis TaxID=95485 RepID=A0A4Q2AFG8_9BURK|nr:hypothetical protein [Burkholderia stabilis]RXV68592.1 hypothetical protein D1006_25910 [Burkholderia stabilis]
MTQKSPSTKTPVAQAVAAPYARATDASSPRLETETKFMQQYRIAAAVHGGGDIVAVRNGNNQVEAFTVGTDGTVWNFFPDPASDTGYSAMSTGLAARWVVAGLNSAGRIVLFAANNLNLNYVIETGKTGSDRWGSVMTATMPLPVNATAIAGLYAAQIAGKLYVAALTKFQSASPGTSYSLATSIWDQKPGVFQSTSVTLSTLNCVWSGSSASTAQFTVLDTVYLGYNVSTQQVTRYPFAATFKSLAVATSLDPSGNNKYFSVLSDGNLYQMVGGSGGIPYSWAQVTQSMSFRDVQSAVSSSGRIELFTLDTGARLCHFTPNQQSATGWSNTMVIQTGVALLGVTQLDQGEIQAFTVGTTQATLSTLIEQQDSGNWQITPLEVPTSGQVEEFISYSTDLMVYDAAGAPMPNAPVQVWASSQTQIVVNGANYTVDAHTPANLTCSPGGSLSITQGTGILGIPALQINLVNVMPSGQAIALEQYAGVQEQLATVTGTDLMNARTADGQYLLQDQYRTVEETDSLASAFNQCMALTQPAAVKRSLQPPVLGTAPKLGVSCVEANRTGDLTRLGAPTQARHWQLDFSAGKPKFRTLTAEQAEHLIHEKRAKHALTTQSVGGFGNWIGSIGDFVEGVVSGIVNVVDTIITTVGSAINAAITFVVNGVQYLFETVVQFVQDAFDLVEVFFAQVQVIFEQIFEWLGFLFSWPDILRTHDALYYTLEQFLDFLPGAVGGIQTKFDQGITQVKNQISAIFDQLVNSVGGTSTLGGYTDSQTPTEPVYSSGNANNIVLNATVENSPAATQTTAVPPSNTGPWDILTQQIQSLTTSVQNDPAFNDALAYMNNLGGSPDQIFSQLLSALLRVMQGLANAMLSGVQAVVDGVLQLVQTFLTSLKDLFTADWNIPFVTQFYAWLTDGSQLSLGDLFALVLAIPSTIIYKAVYGKAPFPDQASVDSFKASFSAQTMLANSGLAATSAAGKAVSVKASKAQAKPVQDNTPSAAQELLGIASVVSTAAYAFISAGLDVRPTTGAGVVDPLVKTLTKFALGGEIVAQAAACPWIFSSGGPDCATADGASKWMYIYTTLGVTLDSAFTIYDEAFPENNDTTWGIVLASLYGVGHAVVTGVTFTELSGFSQAGNIVMLIPEIGKLLKLPAVETATSGISLVVIAAADALCITSAGVLGFADLNNPSNASLRLGVVPGAVPRIGLDAMLHAVRDAAPGAVPEAVPALAN